MSSTNSSLLLFVMLIMRTAFVNVLILYAKHLLCSSILLPFAALLLIWEMMLHKSPTLFTFLLKVWNPKSSFKYVWAIVHHCRWQRRLPRQLTQHCTWPLASISTNPCSRTTKRVKIVLLLNPSTRRTTLGPCPWTLILHNKCLMSSSRSITTTKKARMILPKKHRSPPTPRASKWCATDVASLATWEKTAECVWTTCLKRNLA